VSNESLAEYITEQLRQGYSEEQVRQSLLQNGYPRSMVDAAFVALRQDVTTKPRHAPSIASASPLASYIKTYLAQGYQPEQLRLSLLQQGYSAADVDGALDEVAGRQTVRHELHLPVATVLKVAVLLILIAGIIFGVSLLKGKMTTTPGDGGSRLLDVRLSLDASAAAPGETVNAEADIINMGSAKRYDVTLTYELRDSDGVAVWSGGGKTKAVETSLADAERIVIPAETPDGQYQVVAVADYGTNKATASSPLTVQEQPATAQPEGNQQQMQTNGKQPPVVMMGGEEQQAAADEAAAAARRGDPAKAESLCTSIANQAARDACLDEVVLLDRQPSHCAAIASPTMRDNCYTRFIIERRYDLCPKVTGEEAKRLCADLQRIERLSNVSLPTSNWTLLNESE